MPSASESAEEKGSFTDFVETAVIPIDLRKSEVVFGAAEYILIEVFTHWMLRYLFKIEKRALVPLVAMHAASIPFIGGAGAAGGVPHPLGYEAPFTDLAMDGAKGIPGLFIGQYVVNTALQGMHIPKISFKDVLVTAASKILARLIMSGAYPNLGETFRNNLDILDQQFVVQAIKSRVAKKE